MGQYTEDSDTRQHIKANFICCSSRKANFDQNSEIKGLRFCASMKLCTQPATLAKCPKIIELKCPPCMKVVTVLNFVTSH